MEGSDFQILIIFIPDTGSLIALEMLPVVKCKDLPEEHSCKFQGQNDFVTRKRNVSPLEQISGLPPILL